MANIIRSAKSGSDWTTNELVGFNITVVGDNVAAFFGNPNLPASTVDPIILMNVGLPPGPVAKSTRLFFRYLQDAMELFPPGQPTEAAVDTFAFHLLGLLDYDEPNRAIYQRMEIGFIMCGQRVDATPDICVMDDNYLLLVQEDKRHQPANDPEPQLIAGAVAAFYENNRRRRVAGGQLVNHQSFAGVTLTGTAPTVYKITITSALLEAVSTAQYAPQQTIVHRFTPPVPDPSRYSRDGMMPLENRRVVLQCFEAFKSIMGS